MTTTVFYNFEIKEEKENEMPKDQNFIIFPTDIEIYWKVYDAEISEHHKQMFKDLCQECQDVFSSDSSDIGKTILITIWMRISHSV